MPKEIVCLEAVDHVEDFDVAVGGSCCQKSRAWIKLHLKAYLIGGTENLQTLHFWKLKRLHRETENTDQRLLVCRGEIFLVRTKSKSRNVLILLSQVCDELEVLNIEQGDFIVVHGECELFIS